MAQEQGDRRGFDRRKTDRRKVNRRQPERRREWISAEAYDYTAEEKVHGRRKQSSDKRVGLPDRRVAQKRIKVRRKSQRRAGDRRKLSRRVEDRLLETGKLRRIAQPHDTAKALVSEAKPERPTGQVAHNVRPGSKPADKSSNLGKKVEGDTFKPVWERITDFFRKLFIKGDKEQK